MTIERASDNPFPSILMVEGDPEALATDAAAGQQRLAVDSTDHLLYLVDDAGVKTAVGGGGSSDLDAIITASSGQDIADALAGAAAPDSGNVFATMADVGGGSGTFYAPPTVTNYAANFAGSGTTVAATVSAPTTGDKLVAIIFATGRGADSITQTNTVWTQRYTGNGNGVYLEVWTGVVTGTGGTTATANFTGSNVNYIEVFTVNSAASAFTAATAAVTGTSASATLANVVAGSMTVGDHYILATSAGSAIASSYSHSSHGYVPLTTYGGLARSGILRSNATAVDYWSISSSAGAYFAAIIQLT